MQGTAFFDPRALIPHHRQQAHQGRHLAGDDVGWDGGQVIAEPALVLEPGPEGRGGEGLAQFGHDAAGDVDAAPGIQA